MLCDLNGAKFVRKCQAYFFQVFWELSWAEKGFSNIYIFFGIKKKFMKKITSHIWDLRKGFSGQKMKDFDFSSCATPRLISG